MRSAVAFLAIKRMKAMPFWILAVIFMLSGCSSTRMLHGSEASIRSSLLEKTPVGTSKADVEAFFKQRGWWSSPNKNGDLWAYLGRYGLLNDYRVFAAWVFDKNGRLSDIEVRKRNDFL